MHLLVGLGNPGPKYRDNRHNVGFMVVDRLCEQLRLSAYREKFKGLFTKGSLGRHELVVLKPQTFMNLSGESAQLAMTFFKINSDHLTVVHDELDLPFGEVRVKVGGGTAGHNGLKSMVSQCGGPGFRRVRIGIGRPRSGPVERFVLSDFDSSERAELDGVVDRGVGALIDLIQHGPNEAMNRHNSKPKSRAP